MNHSSNEPHDCCQSEKKKTAWYRKPVPMLLAASFFLLGLSYVFPALTHFHHAFLDYLRMMAVPIGIGFLAGGMIDQFIPDKYITKTLTGHKKRTIFYAAGLGFLMSACSHGILALSMELHKKGASGPAVVSFLLASPWANLPVTLLLVGFFGWRGLLIILLALLTALLTGLILQLLDQKGMIEKNKFSRPVDSTFSIKKDIRTRIKNFTFSRKQLEGDIRGVFRGMKELGDMIFSWILFGMILASLASAFIPAGIFTKFFGPSLLGLLITLAAATVLEVCSEGTSPLAFEIYKNTGALGNAFAFLMGGVVTDYTEIGLVWKNLGRKTALWMLALTLPQVLIWGVILNSIFGYSH